MRVTTILTQILASVAIVPACGGRTMGEGTADPAPDPDASVMLDADARAANPDANRPNARPDASTHCSPVLLRPGGCVDVWHSPCGLPPEVQPSDGMTASECLLVCGSVPNTDQCTYYESDDLPGPSFACYTCTEGRRPHGFVDDRTPPRTASDWFRTVVRLEHASIEAFQILARELEEHGAPAHLMAGARDAEADEVRHTRTMAKVGRVPVPPPGEMAPALHRALVDIAIENATEGCVRETFGALVAGYQAKHAKSKAMRSVMTRIAIDEMGHAELAWNVHQWAMARLTSAERTRVSDAMQNAREELLQEARKVRCPSYGAQVGLPAPSVVGAFLEQLTATLFVPTLAA